MKTYQLNESQTNSHSHAVVFSPHPDDAEFGIAGTVARWVKEDKKVVYAVVTNGNKGTNEKSMNPDDLAAIREKEQIAAAEMLGVSEVVFMEYEDQGLEESAEFRKNVVRLIRKYRPHTIVTADPYRRYIWHRDHRVTGQVVLDSVFPLARDHLSFPDLLEEGLEPHKVQRILFWGSEEPNFRMDISDYFDVKIEALYCHSSQIGHYELNDLKARMKERYRSLAEDEEFDMAESFHRIEIFR